MKTCSKCKKERKVWLFRKRGRVCMACLNEASKERNCDLMFFAESMQRYMELNVVTTRLIA